MTFRLIETPKSILNDNENYNNIHTVFLRIEAPAPPGWAGPQGDPECGGPDIEDG